MAPEVDPPRFEDTETDQDSSFAEVSKRREAGVIAQMWGFLTKSGKWWLLPILLALLVIGILLLLSATPAGLFIYPLF